MPMYNDDPGIHFAEKKKLIKKRDKSMPNMCERGIYFIS